MSDLVSRSYLLAEYDRRHQGLPGGARQIIEEAPSAEQWIPCESHHYPDEEEDVLVCSDTGNMCVTHGCKFDSLDGEFEFFTPGWKFGEVVAWMPLPEPYVERRTDGGPNQQTGGN